jgi:hypothetical protein
LSFENVRGLSAGGRVIAGEYLLPSGVEPYVIELFP